MKIKNLLKTAWVQALGNRKKVETPVYTIETNINEGENRGNIGGKNNTVINKR